MAFTTSFNASSLDGFIKRSIGGTFSESLTIPSILGSVSMHSPYFNVFTIASGMSPTSVAVVVFVVVVVFVFVVVFVVVVVVVVVVV